MPSDTRDQIANAPHEGGYTMFLEGPAGAGKTTIAVARLRSLLERGVPGRRILVLTPQRTLAMPYLDLLHSAEVPGGSDVDTATVGGLARRSVELFWPIIAGEAGFAHPEREPIFLTLESAQYHMDRVLDEYLLERRYFDGIKVRRNRLASQILDNLNKAAVVGFPHDQIAQRLLLVPMDENIGAYGQAQEVASAFRDMCLEHGLLDYSLQMETFVKHVLQLVEGRMHLFGRYRHLIVDNVEEDVPVAHDLVRDWLGECESALLVYDEDAGYRAFLGADPDSALALRARCRRAWSLDGQRVSSDLMQALGRELSPHLSERAAGSHLSANQSELCLSAADVGRVLHRSAHRFHPEMLEWVADRVSSLVAGGVPPSEIAILAPYLSDALRFTLMDRLSRYGVPVATHRPSRALKDESSVRSLLTLAALAHPDWEVVPQESDVVQMLVQAIEGMDLVRAQLLCQIVYRRRQGRAFLSGFELLQPAVQERISFVLGGRYGELCRWIERYQARESGPLQLDHFFGELFADLLSRAGFGFHDDMDAAQAAANLIESFRKFRRALVPELLDGPAGKEYLRMVQRGVLAAQYLGAWAQPDDDAVLLVPAYTFLMRNRPVDYQFWLEAGSVGWAERPYQPLTHPHVLSRRWPEGRRWTDSDETSAKQLSMERLLLGLTRRCRKAIYLAISEMGEQGYEQRGPLLALLQRLLRRVAAEEERGPEVRHA